MPVIFPKAQDNVFKCLALSDQQSKLKEKHKILTFEKLDAGDIFFDK